MTADAGSGDRFALGARRGLQACASTRGTFTILALDHRQNLRRELRPDDPAAVTYDDMVGFKRAVVVETARRLSAIGGDILKAEFPYDASVSDPERWRDACAELDAASSLPWVLLPA